MPLDHQEFLGWLGTYLKLQSGADVVEFEEVGSEVILHESVGFVEIFANFKLWFAYLEQHLVRVDIADLKVDELNAVGIVFGLAKEILGGFLELTDGFDGGQFHFKTI